MEAKGRVARVIGVTCGVACVYWLLALGLAWQAGAFGGSWGSDSDEAAHFLNGVMVLDYAKAGLPGHPLRYAENYYQHYPKIGLGHWPPLFALVEAAWFLFAPVGYGPALVLVNLLAAVVAALVWAIIRRGLGLPSWLAWAAGAVWLLLPLVREYSVMFMAEMLLTLCATAAVMAWARESVWFGGWAGLALLTKGTGIALAPLPVMAAALSGDWRFFRKRWVWLSAFVVLLLAAGWYAKAPGARHERVAPYGGLHFIPRRLPETLRAVNGNLGPAVALLALVGVGAAWRRRKHDRLLVALVAFLPGHVALRMAVGAWETRHLVMVMPELLVLAAVGLEEVRGRLGSGWRGWVLVGVVAVGTAAQVGSRWPQRVGTDGFDEAAAALGAAQRILVAGTVPAEGALICSVALEDGGRRPARTVVRGTKVLVESDFLGWRERALVRNGEEVGAVLASRRVEAVVLDRESDRAYVTLVREYMAGAGAEWGMAGVYRGRAEVWVRKGPKGLEGQQGR